MEQLQQRFIWPHSQTGNTRVCFQTFPIIISLLRFKSNNPSSDRYRIPRYQNSLHHFFTRHPLCQDHIPHIFIWSAVKTTRCIHIYIASSRLPQVSAGTNRWGEIATWETSEEKRMAVGRITRKAHQAGMKSNEFHSLIFPISTVCLRKSGLHRWRETAKWDTSEEKERRLAELPDKLPPFPNFHSLSQEVRTPSLKRDYEMKDTRDASNDSWTNFQKSSQGRHGIQKKIKISELFQRSKLQLFKSFYRKISNVLI